MTRPTNSGWQQGQRNKGRPSKPLEILPTQWDELLRRFGLDEQKALDSPVVREWARKNYQRRFVPSKAIEAFGISEDI